MNTVDFLILFVVLISSHLVHPQCVPKPVLRLSVQSNSTLSWSVADDETCDISYFEVNINRDGASEYTFQSETTSVDISFLTFCVTWIFSVRAVSESQRSPVHVLIARSPLPADADIALKSLEVVEVDGSLQLVWQLEDEIYSNCADSYRITVDDEDNGNIRDVYVADKFLDLEFLSACVVYEFGVRVINSGRPTQEGPLLSVEYEAPSIIQNPPRLIDVSLRATEADITWHLDTLTVNRCPVRTFYVESAQHFNISLPISDTPDRQPVVVNLKSLRSNSLYLLKVSVENSGGVSRPSLVGIQTLDLDTLS